MSIDRRAELAETEAAHARDQLARSLRFTESLLAAVPTPVFFKDTEGRYLGCNRAFTEVMGLTPEQIRGKTVHECWPSEHADVYHERDLDLVRNPALQIYEFKVRDRDGEERDVIYAKNVFLDEADRVAGIVGAFVDISQRKRAENALRYRLAFESLVTSISTRFIGLSPHQMDAGIDEALAAIGRFTAVDRAYVFLLRDRGATMDNTHEWCAEGIDSHRRRLQGLGVGSFPSVADHVLQGRAAHIPRVADLPVDGEERREFERESIRSLVLVPVMSAGQVLGFLGLDAVRAERSWTDDDIALLRIVGEIFATGIERQRADAALAERDARLRFITDHMVDIVSQIDADRALVYVSPSVSRVLGYRPEELLGRPITRLVHAEDLERTIAAIRLARQRGLATCRVEYRFANADGRFLWFESTVSILVDQAGAFTGAIFGSRDVTERKRLEEQLREAQKLESVGRLAAGVAHDLNNMLTPILGYADLLLRDFHERDQRHARAGQILRAAEGARDLTRRLLAFSRRQVLSLRVVDLRQVVAGMEKLLHRTLRENLALELALGSEPCAVKADAGQLEQVIMNLAINAQDAMPDGGTLLIQTTVVDLEAGGGAVPADVKPGRYAMLAVTDTGCGMDAATRARVFEPFFTTKEPGRGTGLGLASVYGIVKQHEGAIWVESEPQRGASFRILLRLVDTPPETAPAEPPRPPLRSRRGETVMVAEDNAMVRGLVVSALQSLGCNVLSAASGRECLEALARHEGAVHLLLTDVIMPDLNGRDLHAEVARRHPHVKVLFMSGYADDIIAHHGVLDAGVSYLQKPFRIDALLAKLREVLDARGGARD